MTGEARGVDPSKESRTSRAVKDKVESDLRARLSGGLGSPSRVREVLASVYRAHSPEGLTELTVERKPGKAGVFVVKAAASPSTPVIEALAKIGLDVADLDLGVGKTVCRAVVNRKVVITERSGDGKHAEEKVLEYLEANWATLVTDKRTPVFLLFQVSRSPCGADPDPSDGENHDCAGKLLAFVEDRRRLGFRVRRAIDVASIYQGKTQKGASPSPVGGRSTVDLQELKERGKYTIGTWDLVRELERSLGRKLEEGDLPPATVKRLEQRAAEVTEELDNLGHIRIGRGDRVG